MQQGRGTLAPFYKGWDRYNGLLTEAIAPLSREQLALRAETSLRPIRLLAAHIIGARVGWFQGVMGEGGPALAVFDRWDADDAPPRGADELVTGLHATWGAVRDCLDRWTPAMLEDPFTTRRGRAVTRQWIIWHVLEHDIHHGGELCLTLGMHGLRVPDL